MTDTTPTPGEIGLRHASEYTRRRVRWLPNYTGLIPLAMLTILVGYQGDGKTMLICRIAAGETRNGRRVVIATTEDEIESVLRPRLEAAGADLDLVLFAVLKTPGGEDGALMLPDHGTLLVEAIEREQPSLFVLDPMEAFLGVSVDSWKSPDMRRALRPISTAAERVGCAALVVGYVNRSASTSFLARIAESMAFSRAARSALLLWPDPDDPEGDKGERRILALGKTNLAPRGTLSRCYRIEAVTLPADGDLEETDTARIVYTGDSPLTANDLLSGKKKEDRSLADEPTELVADAMEWLEQTLSHGDGHVTEVLAAGGAEGFSDDTLRRAAKRLGVTKRQEPRFGGKHFWSLTRAQDIRSCDLQRSTANNGNQAESTTATHGDQAESDVVGRTSPYIAANKDDSDRQTNAQNGNRPADPGSHVDLEDWLEHLDEPEPEEDATPNPPSMYGPGAPS